MVAAARLRRAEQRIDHLRPYAQALRKMTRQVAEAAGVEARNLPVLQEHEEQTNGRGPAGHRRPRPRRLVQLADHPRGGRSSSASSHGEGKEVALLGRRPPRRLDDALPRRGAARRVRRLHRPPRLRQRPRDRRRADRRLRRRGARPGRPDLQPLRLAADPVRAPPDAAADPAGRGLRRGRRGAARRAEEDVDEELAEAHRRALWVYEPEPEELLGRADPRVRAALGLPGAARVDRVRARRADDRDAERGREREGGDQRPDPGDEPGAPGRDHPGDPRGRRRRRGRSARTTWKRRRRRMADNGQQGNGNIGHGRAGDRRRHRRRLPRRAARDLSALEDRDPAGGGPDRAEPDLRGPAAPRRRPRARDRDGRDRRPPARRQGDRHRRPDHGPGRQGDARAASSTCSAR